MARRYDTVTFLSDLGTTDEHVGVVHAMFAELAPGVRVVDLTHEIAPFDVRAGSLSLARAVPYLPEGVILAAVDPATPEPRPAIAVEVGDGAGVFIGPDNGLIAPGVALAGGAQRAVALAMAPGSAGTCRVRDLLAPVAAAVCTGVDLEELGTPIDPAMLLPAVVPLPRFEGDTVVAEVLWVDRFGNCQLNLGPEDLQSRWSLDIGSVWSLRTIDPAGQPRTRVATWVAQPAVIAGPGLGLMADAHGMMAICADRSPASVEMDLAAGDSVVLTPSSESSGGAVTSPVTLRTNLGDRQG